LSHHTCKTKISSQEIVNTLLHASLLLFADTSAAYAGALALLHALSVVNINLKLEAARKVLTAMFMKSSAPHQFAKQVQTLLSLAVGFVFDLL
jgi:hypothetical protein